MAGCEERKGKGRFAQTGQRIIADIKEYGAAILAFLLCAGVLNGIFGAFCPMRLFIGLPCPGCGISRAVFLLMTGQVNAAWQMNPMAVPVILAALYFFGNRYLLGRKAKGMRAVLIALCVLLMINYCMGMYRYFPDRAPYVYHQGNFLEKVICCQKST